MRFSVLVILLTALFSHLATACLVLSGNIEGENTSPTLTVTLIDNGKTVCIWSGTYKFGTGQYLYSISGFYSWIKFPYGPSQGVIAYAHDGMNLRFPATTTLGRCTRYCGLDCCVSQANIYAANYGCSGARVAGLSGRGNRTATIDGGEKWDPASVSATADVVIRTRAVRPFNG